MPRAAHSRPVEVFVSMYAILAFAREATPDRRYRGGAFSQLMKDKHAPDVLVLLRQGNEFGNLKIWACSMALDVAGLEMDHLVEELFDGPLGLTKFLSDAEAGQLVTLFCKGGNEDG